MVDIGNHAPDFSLVDTSRERRSLGEFKGKNTVLAFFPAAFSSVCEKEMCAFRDSMAELNDLNANVVGISVDGPFTNAAFAERNGLQFPLLSDYSYEAVRAYGVALDDFAGMPGYTAAQRSVFILDAEGTVRFKWIADNPGQEPDYSVVKEELHKIG
ncbi:MAG: redoxin domain-containing protein [Bacteroidetes bacterium]|nr:redoxin domain-containing protein [Bacteroidota bacterium]